VPYAVEAWPEGDQRHLSAESALYCRVVTEGIFGIVPTGFSSFSLKPSMPDDWPHMKLNHVRAFQNDFSIEVSRTQKGYRAVVATQDGFARDFDIPEGGQAEIVL
jgi:cellobiose phosphorylase